MNRPPSTTARDGLPSIAIVGGGLAGWMAAAALANAFKGRENRIRLIDLAQAPSIEMGEASIPTLRTFHDRLGIAEDNFIRRTHATFNLGTVFRDWSGPGRAFMHPFGHYGTGIGTVGFHHCWFKMRALGDRTELSDYSLAAVAASLDRFARPVADASSVLSSYSYGFHFDIAAYIDLLREYATSRGIVHSRSDHVTVKLRGEDGFIDELDLGHGETLAADLYLDCSGASGLLIENALRTGYEDWSEWLPCNRAIVCRSTASAEMRPLTEIKASPNGWHRKMPLQRGDSHGYVYCSRFCDDRTAKETLRKQIGNAAIGEPPILQFTNGRRRKFWNKNCVALDAAAGFLEPLESTAGHLIQSAIARLLTLLPGGTVEPAAIDEYNRLTTIEFEQIRDFLILHYKANHCASSAMWDHCRGMSIPDSLAYRLELFKSRGRVNASAGEVFFLPSWLSLFAGLGIEPRRHHPFADGLPLEDLKQQMRLIRSTVRQATETMPTHRAFVAEIVGQTG